MAFTQAEIVKLAAKTLAAGVVSAEDNKQYYEASLANQTVVDDKSVWSQMTELQDLTANNLIEACANAFANDHLIQAYGYNADGSVNDATAVRLTPMLGSNQHDWKLYYQFNDPASGAIRNIISPTQIPRSSGLPSAAYQMRIFRGKPSLGNEIGTTEGFDGAEVGFFISAANGMVLFSEDTKPAAGEELWAVFFQYVGATGGGSFSGNSILLEDPEGNWRVRNDFPQLRFERREYNADTELYEWNSYANMGHSLETDGVVLTRPHAISVDLTGGLNEGEDQDRKLKSAFKVSGTNEAFVYGNTDSKTVIETERDSHITRAASLREPDLIENRPLKDNVVVLDTRVPKTDPAYKKSVSWVAKLDYNEDLPFIQFNEIAFETVALEDKLGATDTHVPVRMSVVRIVDNKLIQETVSPTGLEAEAFGALNFELGEKSYAVTPRFVDTKAAEITVTLDIPDGYYLELSSGTYDFVDPADGITKQQEVPWQRSLVEYVDTVRVADEISFNEITRDNAGTVLDNGVFTDYGTGEVFPLVSVGEHVPSNYAVLGNYEDSTYVATGSGGLYVLFEDDTTLAQFFTEDDRIRIETNNLPTFFEEVTEFELDLNGVFASEMDDVGWDVVNVRKILPLIRYEGAEQQGYRVSIWSNLAPDYRFQENVTKFQFQDGKIDSSHQILPTIDADNPEYKELNLPRKSFTVNRETPRTIKFEFEKPVKLYGYYKDVTDVNDPQGTGTFVPSIKAEVLRVFEEAVVVGADLEDRLDSLEGDIEWQEATERNLPTLHIETGQVLADEDGEWLLWSDDISLFDSTDVHQWIFSTGQEAFFEIPDTHGTWHDNNSWFEFDPVVVHVPDDNVAGFEVSFVWSDTFNNNGNIKYANMTLYVNSHGRGFDSKINLNIPRNASINWRFRQRRSGEYSYIATPMNDNLASVGLGTAQNLEAEIPQDPQPPIDVG